MREIVAIVRRPPSIADARAREEAVRASDLGQVSSVKPLMSLQADPSSRDVTHVPRPTWEEASIRPREFPIKYPAWHAR